MKELKEKSAKSENKKEKFVEEIDFYFENGFMVLTEHFLKKRGYCCGNGCRHCPYSEKLSQQKA
jgi:hypothetical protein